ncbi:MAG: uroporphyrinogen-III C-methyltransferase [Gemmataceae bacterium]
MTHPVALVGAGPGHPGLLTVRAAELLSRADYVLYDRLVPEALLCRCRPDAERVCVEQLPGEHAQRYPHIHATLIAAARAGRRVVRLKGGDPFVFGRGAEEAQALRAAGVPFEVVPGVTAGLGATAFAGIPATHRRHASAVAFVTGHEYPGKEGSRLDWPALAAFPGTLVFYMGVTRLASLADALTLGGKPADTPAAMVQQGTTGRQRTVVATLGTLAEAATREGVRPPALVVVGEVVGLRDEVSWFERLPLFGRCVLVTRPRGQADGMAARVAELGGEAVLLPVVDVAAPASYAEIDAAIDRVGAYQWLVFTSVNGVAFFLGRLRARGKDMRALAGAKLAAIGPATADALRGFHLEPDLVPEEYNSEGLVAALRDRVAGTRVLLARADRGLELLRDELGKVAAVEQIAVYRQTDEVPDGPGLAMLRAGEIDLVSLTSSNIAKGLAAALGEEGRGHVASGRTRLVSISPRTTAAARACGLGVAAEAERYTTEGVLEAMTRLVSADP